MTRASPACNVYAVTGPNAAKLWNSPTCCPYQIWKSGRFGNFSVRKICLPPKLGYRTCLNCIRITWVCLKLRGNDFQGLFLCFFVAFLVETWRRSCVSSHRSFVTSTTPTTEPNQVHEPTHNKPRRSHIRGGFARREEEEGRTETRTEITARRDVPPQAKRPAAGESQGGAGRAGAPLAFTVR